MLAHERRFPGLREMRRTRLIVRNGYLAVLSGALATDPCNSRDLGNRRRVRTSFIYLADFLCSQRSKSIAKQELEQSFITASSSLLAPRRRNASAVSTAAQLRNDGSTSSSSKAVRSSATSTTEDASTSANVPRFANELSDATLGSAIDSLFRERLQESIRSAIGSSRS